jgi:hypothetical protein
MIAVGMILDVYLLTGIGRIDVPSRAIVPSIIIPANLRGDTGGIVSCLDCNDHEGIGVGRASHGRALSV